MTDDTDRALGMDRPIARRDFLNGAAVTGAALALGLPARAAAAPQDVAGYYPPVLTGLRGSHPGSYEAAHGLRDGNTDIWSHPALPATAAETYDLVVVGAGISGLAAAHFYREAHADARILILDNHDDFGGHAKRNEFRQDGRIELMNGGTLMIDSPRPYSPVADGLLRTLGIDPPALSKRCFDETFYTSRHLGRGVFFDRETFGADKMIAGAAMEPGAILSPGAGRRSWRELLADAPLSPRVRADIARIYEAHTDYLPGLTSPQKKDRLSRISYTDFLVKIAGCDPGVIPYFRALTQDEWGVGADAVSALDVWAFDLPGFQGMNLAPGSAPRMGNTPAGYADSGSYKFHFPDGNASIARLLVRRLIPAAVPGHTVDDVVFARADYTQLDRVGAPTRIRLNSIVLGARNVGDPARATQVEVAYTRLGRLHRVRATSCVMAGYNMMIPYLCPDLPAAQKDALHYLVKIPLVYTSVAIKTWRAFDKMGISEIYAPGSYHISTRLNPKTTIGGYTSVTTPDAPALVFMVRNPCGELGAEERAQHRTGRADILATSFETFERRIRDQLGRMLAPGGFDPADDISAITVNRWPHGYAYEYNYLFDPVFAPGQAPHELGRARHGRIVIANSDAGAAAYTDCAIDQAHRAVQEL